MINAVPDGLNNPSRVLGSLNGQHHVTDVAVHAIKSYGFFVHETGCTFVTVDLDPDYNSGDLTWLNGASLTGPAEYIIPGIRSVQLTTGGISLFKDGQ